MPKDMNQLFTALDAHLPLSWACAWVLAAALLWLVRQFFNQKNERP